MKKLLLFVFVLLFSHNLFPQVTLLSPNGGENWQVGTPQYLAWTNANMTDTVNIDYSTDNGTTWNRFANSANSMYPSYSWLLPTIESVDYKVPIALSLQGKAFEKSINSWCLCASVAK